MLLVTSASFAQSFNIRGVMPWHSYLSGPSAWNEDDYRKYLDDCQKKGINFIGFHNYTGGGERYFNYVEPMIKIQYKNVLPTARFDDGSTVRWGYLPMKVSKYPYGTQKLFKLPRGAQYFGAENAVNSRTTEERYEKAQKLTKKVLVMAHERGMQMAMGFEFGVAPPEYASIRTHSDMYWLGNGTLIYNPFDPDATGILYATIDNILDTYKGMDWIYLWLNEHCMFGINPNEALQNPLLADYYKKNVSSYEGENVDETMKFLGVWSQAYIQKAYEYIKKRSPGTKIVIGGWGNANQMPLLLKGLNKTLPKEIVFSMLNPDQGKQSHPSFFKEIARTRNVWSIPWLEGDESLWYLQPRVRDMKNQVKNAHSDGLNGVVAIHWRTEEVRLNFETFARFALHPEVDQSTSKIYQDYCNKEFGEYASKNLAFLLTQIDTTGILSTIQSTEFFAYQPSWGRLSQAQVALVENIIHEIDDCISHEKGQKMNANLKWMRASYEFAILFNEFGHSLEPAWKMRDDYMKAIQKPDFGESQILNARTMLDHAPVEKMVTVFASRVRSQGELGELSSIIQRVYGEYQQLCEFMKTLP